MLFVVGCMDDLAMPVVRMEDAIALCKKMRGIFLGQFSAWEGRGIDECFKSLAYHSWQGYEHKEIAESDAANAKKNFLFDPAPPACDVIPNGTIYM